MLQNLLKVEKMAGTGIAKRKFTMPPLSRATTKTRKYLKREVSPGAAEGFRVKNSSSPFV